MTGRGGRGWWGWAGAGLALAAAVLAAQGCTYLRHRGATACRMVEVGVTHTKTPSLELYACGVGIAAFGAGQVDGYLYGVGGGEIGKVRHYEKTLGAGFFGYEEMGWDQFDPAKQETLDCHYVGLAGWIAHPERRPGYAPARVHTFHVGYVGIILNIRYLELVNFLTGWFGLDLTGEDTDLRGKWPWQSDFTGNEPERLQLFEGGEIGTAPEPPSLRPADVKPLPK